MPDRSHLEVPAGLRRAVDADADALIALISAAYAEHPGCVLDLPGVDDDLPAPGAAAGQRGSPWWVVERAGEVVASIGAGPVVDGAQPAVELKRLYLAPSARGHGLATRLVRLVEAHAAGLGASQVVLWSDTRFLDAHHRYGALAYHRTGRTRELHDPSETTEFEFTRDVTPAGPDVAVCWVGPDGRDAATLTRLPDGRALASDLRDAGVAVRVEVDGAWRTRRAEVRTDGAPARVLTSDGAGRWWLDGSPAPWLEGCEDVDVEVTPVTNTLPIRRLLAAGVANATVRAAWVRVPGTAVEVLEQRYTRTSERGWHYEVSGRQPGFSAELTVDAYGLVESYGDLWHRR